MPLLVDVSSRGYHRPRSQHFGVDMNINTVVIFINFLFTKLFRKTKDFLTPDIDYLSRIWHIFWDFFLSSMLFNFVLVWLYKYVDMSVTESYADEKRVWRTKL